METYNFHEITFFDVQFKSWKIITHELYDFTLVYKYFINPLFDTYIDRSFKSLFGNMIKDQIIDEMIKS